MIQICSLLKGNFGFYSMSEIEEYIYCIMKHRGENPNDQGKQILFAEVVLLGGVINCFQPALR